MNTRVSSEMDALCSSIIAFVTGERTVARMNAIVRNEKGVLGAQKIAFTAGI